MRVRDPEEVVMVEVCERVLSAVSLTQRVELSPEDLVTMGVKSNFGAEVDD